MKIERSFDSRTHKVKEWTGKQAGGNQCGQAAVPPCIVATNWAEDVLKPAGEEAGIPKVSYQWFRLGHATVEHHGNVVDKAVQGQLRHSKVETTRNVYMQQVSAETYIAVLVLVLKNRSKLRKENKGMMLQGQRLTTPHTALCKLEVPFGFCANCLHPAPSQHVL